MQCFYKVEGKSTIYYFDETTIKALNSPDQVTVLNTIYKANNGKEIPSFNWSPVAPWYDRLKDVVHKPGI